MAEGGFPGKQKLRWKLQLRVLIKVHSGDQYLGRGKKEADKEEQDIELHWGPYNSPGWGGGPELQWPFRVVSSWVMWTGPYFLIGQLLDVGHLRRDGAVRETAIYSP